MNILGGDDVRRAFQVDDPRTEPLDLGVAWSRVDRKIDDEPRRRAVRVVTVTAVAAAVVAVAVGPVARDRGTAVPGPVTPPTQATALAPSPTSGPGVTSPSASVIASPTSGPAVASPSGPALPTPTSATSSSPRATPPARTPAAVPWVDIPYDPTQLPAIAGTVRDPSVPWCTAGDIAVANQPAPTFARVPGFADLQYPVSADIAFTARPGKRCGLQGAPSVQIRDGRSRLIAATRDDPQPFHVQPYVLLEAGTKAATRIWWGGNHCSGRTPLNAIVTFPNQKSAIGVQFAGQTPPCEDAALGPSGVTAGEFRPAHLPSDGPLTDPMTRIRVRILLPKTLHEGRILHYQVELVALPGVGPVTLSRDRCPAFRQILRDHVGAVSSSEHLLNCAAAPPITTSGVRFEMRIPVPAKVPGYALSFDWIANVPGMSNGGKSLVVRRN